MALASDRLALTPDMSCSCTVTVTPSVSNPTRPSMRLDRIPEIIRINCMSQRAKGRKRFENRRWEEWFVVVSGRHDRDRDIQYVHMEVLAELRVFV